MILINNKNKQKDIYLFKKAYHERLKNIVEKNYSIDVQYSEDFSWGYNSTSTYIKNKSGEEYVARISRNTPEKERDIKKDIAISSILKLSVKTRKYMKNNDGDYSTYIKEELDSQGNILIQDKILSFYPYIHGTPPFDMDENILKQAVHVLSEIHKKDYTNWQIKLEKLEEGQDLRFLHGDMTPSNILVSYEKIDGVVDFEMALIGPVEYDLARLAVFSWFRMEKGCSFGTILKIITETYPKKLALNLLEQYSLAHCKLHLKNLKKNKNVHENKSEYRREVKFVKKKLKELLRFFKH